MKYPLKSFLFGDPLYLGWSYNKVNMQADIDDDKVIQSLLEDPDDHIIVSSVPDDGRAFILQSQ